MAISKLAYILSEIIGAQPEDITANTALIPENGIEPIDVAKLVIECEKAYNITIHDEDVHAFSRVRDVARYIDALVDEGGLESLAEDADRDAWYYE